MCKTIIRNGADAYVIHSRLTSSLQQAGEETDIDIATDLAFEDMVNLFPDITGSQETGVMAVLQQNEVTFRFYSADDPVGSHPETSLIRVTPRILKQMEAEGLPTSLACPYLPQADESYEGFENLSDGVVRFIGLPDETLKRNFVLGIRALRFAANYDLPVENNTWAAIVRTSGRILEFTPVSVVMEEWRKVEAESMHRFVQLLFDSMILHGILPEIAALSRVEQIKNESGEQETVLAHTIEVMRRYPEELPYDWFGTLACMFHDVGKLYTSDFYDDEWHFHQHHKAGAKVTRSILNRLGLLPADVDLICHLVQNHMRFCAMLTERGIRRFKALDEYPRLIEMARAGIKAREEPYTTFNHNMKYLERGDMPEETTEPLLNGKEIMKFASLEPGPIVGEIRDALLQAQIDGNVSDISEAIEFVRNYL